MLFDVGLLKSVNKNTNFLPASSSFFVSADTAADAYPRLRNSGGV